jgi:choline/glycine/proline betaine transport protein
LSRKSTISRPVFFTSAGLLVGLLGFALVTPQLAIDFFTSIRVLVVTKFGWFYIVSVMFFFAFAVWLLVSPYGALKLGKDDEEPTYSRPAWFAMLFAAGIGIGLVFYGVGEPMMHFTSPPVGVGGSAEARAGALPLTFHHWGILAWSMYVAISLPIAYFAYRKGLPLSLRSCFYPVLGERIHGWAGHSIDILAVFGTLFGLATSLAMGAMSVSAGLNRLFGVSHSADTQLIVIAIITAAATVSLVAGVDKGIKRISEINMILAAVLLAFVFVCGPTLEILGSFIEGMGDYLSGFLDQGFRIGHSDPEGEGKWIQDWSVTYWGWWIAWAPFVGMFVARISRGRTIREFVACVMLVPTLVSCIWFAVFGGTALAMEASGIPIAEAVSADISTAVYVMLEQLPMAGITSLFAIVVVTIFFVSSSDSASFVVDMLTSGGHPDPPVWQRVFWATAEGATAAILLYAGGEAVLEGLQAGVVAVGLPFCALMLVMCYCLVKALRDDPGVMPQAADPPSPDPRPAVGGSGPESGEPETP